MPYTTVTVGAVDNQAAGGNLAPGQPSGTGGVLFLVAATRGTSVTLSDPTGYTPSGDTTSGVVPTIGTWLRFATDDANDLVDTDIFSGTSYASAVILRLTGDIWDGAIGSILNQAVVTVATEADTADIPTGALTISPETSDVMSIAVGAKIKGSSQDGVTFTPPTGLTEAVDDCPDGSTLCLQVAYDLSAGNLSADVFDQDASHEHDDPSSSIILVLKPAAGGGVAPTGNIYGPLGGPFRGVI